MFHAIPLSDKLVSVKRLETKLISKKPREETAGKQTWMYTM